MRKIILILLPVLCIGIFSCQKQIDWSVPPSGIDSSNGGAIPPSTNGELLVKSYGKVSGSPDTNVSYYTYNSAKRLVEVRNITSLAGGSNIWNGYERNAAGSIIRRKQYAISGSIPIQGDTAITNYYYSTGANPQILYSISTISVLGISTTDSVTYSYNTNGKLTKSNHYTANFLTGTYEETMRHIFSYDVAGNCNKIEQFIPTNGTLASQQIITLTYDNKTSPYNYTEAESIVMAEEPATTHNILMSKQVLNGIGTLTITNTFNYNSAGKPATGKSTQDFNGTTVTNFTYYYQ